MIDRSFRAVACFTLVYGVLALGMIMGQPRSLASTSLAEAGGNFETSPSQLVSFRYALASAE